MHEMDYMEVLCMSWDGGMWLEEEWKRFYAILCLGISWPHHQRMIERSSKSPGGEDIDIG
jgi:hypothetical protein